MKTFPSILAFQLEKHPLTKDKLETENLSQNEKNFRLETENNRLNAIKSQKLP